MLMEDYVALQIAGPIGEDETWRRKSHGRLKKPLHPTLPVCRIPMKNDNRQAAYQSILSFPHISTDRSTSRKPDRWDHKKLYFTLLQRLQGVRMYYLLTNGR